MKSSHDKNVKIHKIYFRIYTKPNVLFQVCSKRKNEPKM